MNAWALEQLYWCDPRDVELYREWTGFLPKRRADEPYHSGPHTLRSFREALRVTQARQVMEIGFNLGHSAVLFLNLGVRYVHSVDVSERASTGEAVRLVQGAFPHRFSFTKVDSQAGLRVPGGVDLLFIDGAHDRASVERDIRLGLECGVPWLMLDDWHPHFGCVQEATHQFPVATVAVFGNIALCRSVRDWVDSRTLVHE